ncbi:unnamed protein product [Prorocentrum cordatum]|uniref:BPL/LPL catalytic domain-containing protein n=1 Tax=Prorocentrum cordatum TaxID=2364126 RepID=A0ABN9XRM2_9DINO|nr:unnamed protein product [Polarella glacialis]
MFLSLLVLLYVEREVGSFDLEKLTVVSTDFQTAGRGTRDRSWQAMRGKSVLINFCFRFPEDCPTSFVNQNVPNVTKVAACAAVDCLREAAAGVRDPEGEELRFGVKWPNDIVVNGRKIGGILARAIPSPGARLDVAIIGVGINVNTPQEELDALERAVWPATSLKAVAGGVADFDVAALRQRFARNFATELPAFFRGGFAAFRERVNSLEALMGTSVRFRVHETNVVDGTFEGVDDTGCILIRDSSGTTNSYPSGEIIPPSVDE